MRAVSGPSCPCRPWWRGRAWVGPLILAACFLAREAGAQGPPVPPPGGLEAAVWATMSGAPPTEVLTLAGVAPPQCRGLDPGCFRVQARAPEPPAPWREALVHELQALRTFRVNDQPMTTQFGARFAYGADVVDVLFAIHANAVVVAWHGGSVMIASLGTHREDVLRLLAEALPGYPEIAAALRHDAPVGEGRPAGAGTGRAEWQLHDCTGPAQGEFVYYEEEPKPVMNPAPAFPPGIVSRHRGERIIVHALVGVEGKICTVKIMRGTPPATESVVRALREWRFAPARSAGQPVAVWVEIPFVVGT